MKVSSIEQARAIAKSCLQEHGEFAPNPVCTRETETLYGMESHEFVCIINKSNGRVLWLSRRFARRH
ncbi:hypothetical protein KRX19_01520 [Cardiobacteriaceae bacterium TAE3-ERU3]|nr:hypothetical protein [Cardiobacteriaceae bacterium TAE3-ERU3]